MGFVSRLLAGPDDAGARGPTDDFWYLDKLGGGPSATGLIITPEIAVMCSAVFACLKVLGETMGMLPLIVYERTGEDGTSKRRATEDSVYALTHRAPNAWQTPFEFKENLTVWAALHGVGIAIKVYGPTGTVDELIPVHPSRVRVERTVSRTLRYLIQQADGTWKPYTQDEIFHINGLSFDGVSGVSMSRQAREAIGLARAMEAFGARYFANDTTVGLVLEHPLKLSDEAHKRLSDSFSTNFGGVMNAWKPKVLEEGMKMNRLQASGKDAQLIEGRLHQVIEICRFFRMQPHKIAHLVQATFSNIEHQGLEHVTDTIQPWAVRWEQAVARDLILDDEKYFAEFDLRQLIRGDMAARSAYWQIRFNLGTASPNDIRAAEGENPVAGGDRYYVNAATVPLDDKGLPIMPAPAAGADTTARADYYDAPAKDTEAASAATVFAPLMADAADRIARAETRELSKRAGKASEDYGRFAAWVDEYYTAQHGYIEKTLAPVADAWAASTGRRVAVASLAAVLVDDGRLAALGPAFRADPSSIIASRSTAIAARLSFAFSLERAA
jgi:HK97 family phage portal protein